MGSRLESNSNAIRKRIESHTFNDESGEEYAGSKFGGFSDYFRRKKIKLQNLDAELRSQNADNPAIFRGIVVHVNGYTQPSLNDIHKLIVTHGGGFMQYLDGKTTVTHIIASNLTPKKAVEFKRYRIVKPAWVVESVEDGKLLPWDEFRVLAEGAGQRVLGFDYGKVISHADDKSNGYRDQTENSWYTSQLKAVDPPSSTPRFKLLKALSPEDSDDIIDDAVELFRGEAQLELEGVNRQDVLSPSSSTLLSVNNGDAASPSGHLLPSDIAEGDLAELADASFFTSQDSPGSTITRKDFQQPLDNADHAHVGSPPYRGPDKGKRPMEDPEKPSPPAKRTKIMITEERNAILLANPRIRKSTVVHPDFLEQYYRESRLHHLSTWKAALKSQLQSMANEKSASQRQRKKRPDGARRYILHVDFDSFFAAVSLKKHPEYRGKPAVVAHGAGNGSEIASCNYAARRFGVKNGMWMKRGLELCPDLNVMPYDFPAYEEASRSFYEAILKTEGRVQSVSIDEALVDITDTCLDASGSDGVKRTEGSVEREQSRADMIAREIREEVKKLTDCDVSVGIGGNILLAKVALRKAKPAGQYHIKPEEVLDFIGKLEAQDLPGVAYSIGGKLEEIGIKLVGDIRQVSREKLISTLGPKTGEKMWEYARGIDKTEVGDVVVRKSVSAEVNWGVRFESQEQVDGFIRNLCGELSKRLLEEHVKGRQLTLKIMKRSADSPLNPPKHLGHGKCDTFNKSTVFGVCTNEKAVLAKEALSMLKSYGFSPGDLRGLGVQMTKLEPMKTNTDGQPESSQRRLQFKVHSIPKPPVNEPEDPIEDDIVTPKKIQKHPDDDDVGFGAPQLSISTPSRKPLNLSGTQFVIPSQIDPKVLAELPDDIRAKLAQHIDPAKLLRSATRDNGERNINITVPNQSKIDMGVFNSLPQDVRDEIVAVYSSPGGSGGSPSFRKRRDQTLLPQSPRKDRVVAVSKKPIPAPAPLRRRGRPSKADIAARANAHPTLTQSSFIAGRFSRAVSHDVVTTDTDNNNADARPKSRQNNNDMTAEGDEPSEVSAEFLAALPEDLRREVIAERRRAKLLKKSGLNIQPQSRPKVAAKQTDTTDYDDGPIERLLRLPPRPPPPAFTSQKLTSLPELRVAMSEWWSEFRKEGPYDEDVKALISHIEKVVADERDVFKAVGVVKWLAWLVDEDLEDSLVDDIPATQKSKDRWKKALQKVRDGVRQAVRKRDLGVVDV